MSEYTINPGDITPVGWQGAVQHTWTPACDGNHAPGPCPGTGPGDDPDGDATREAGEETS